MSSVWLVSEQLHMFGQYTHQFTTAS